MLGALSSALNPLHPPRLIFGASISTLGASDGACHLSEVIPQSSGLALSQMIPLFSGEKIMSSMVGSRRGNSSMRSVGSEGKMERANSQLATGPASLTKGSASPGFTLHTLDHLGDGLPLTIKVQALYKACHLTAHPFCMRSYDLWLMLCRTVSLTAAMLLLPS